jgi:hypothetical protein
LAAKRKLIQYSAAGCGEGSPQDVHAIEVILGQNPASFSVAGSNLHPPLLHAVFDDYGSASFCAPGTVSFGDEGAIVFFVPVAIGPDVGKALADVHVTKNDVARFCCQFRDRMPDENPVGFTSNMHAREAGNFVPTFEFAGLRPAILPSRIQGGFFRDRPLTEGATLEWAGILVNDGKFGLGAMLILICRGGCAVLLCEGQSREQQ